MVKGCMWKSSERVGRSLENHNMRSEKIREYKDEINGIPVSMDDGEDDQRAGENGDERLECVEYGRSEKEQNRYARGRGRYSGRLVDIVGPAVDVRGESGE
ncbi:hypothetical protein C8R43DRAFT_946936 [Mycena crocata]|nr:hypothetical protein C8R43DRAFT_946929 [Mycena crocata]KAJ7163500.1 hypothetical protein C8R43DRAFT_946936 [Mycena crocata]